MRLDALAFGAHPDDVELTCAGTLIKLADNNYKIGIVSLTQGEMGTRGSPEIRAAEFEQAAKIISTSVHKILDIPDGNIDSSHENRIKVIRLIREYQPKILFAPYWIDRHPDHEHASTLVREAAFLAGIKKIETDQAAHRPYRVIYYPCRFEFQPSFIVDITESHDRKLRAIKAYRSQFHHPRKLEHGDQETNISRPEFLEAVVTRAKQYGSYIGAAHGEPFLVREPLQLDDPVSFFGSQCLDSLL
jgi:N-acetylglucosamine malate deacetylase 1